MKHLWILLIVSLFFFGFSNAQTDSSYSKPWKTPFRRGYIRLGINRLGSDPNPAASPIENVRAGNLGAGNGYTLEFGHIFYFLGRKERRLFNAGLDWTILNLAYSPLNQWEEYAGKRNENIDMDGTNLSAAVVSRLGPVIAINPADKLVIEARFQVSYGLYLPVFSYDITGGTDAGYSFGMDNESFLNSKGTGMGFGATLRYGFFGFSADWSNAKIPVTYYIDEPDKNEVNGTEKIPFKNFQLKVSFTL
jgi:hypothetical protein